MWSYFQLYLSRFTVIFYLLQIANNKDSFGFWGKWKLNYLYNSQQHDERILMFHLATRCPVCPKIFKDLEDAEIKTQNCNELNGRKSDAFFEGIPCHTHFSHNLYNFCYAKHQQASCECIDVNSSSETSIQFLPVQNPRDAASTRVCQFACKINKQHAPKIDSWFYSYWHWTGCSCNRKM